MTFPNISSGDFVKYIGDALSNYSSSLALSQSPLAIRELINPALIINRTMPTSDERGFALQAVLCWAVLQLAPKRTISLLSDDLQLGDLRWTNPLWWKYLILRYLYIQPLHPDRYMNERSRVQTLIDQMGMTSRDQFYGERMRALQEISWRLRSEHALQEHQMAVRQFAAQMMVTPLTPHLRKVLGAAATFRTVFPREQLTRLLPNQNCLKADIEQLIGQRLLLTGDGKQSLLVPAAIREYAYAQQVIGEQEHWHQAAALYCQQQGDAVEAAWHYLHARLDENAAQMLLLDTESVQNTLHSETLIALLEQFQSKRLHLDTWRRIVGLKSNLFFKLEETEKALAATREALQVAERSAEKATCYHRIGKLHESNSIRMAMQYYQKADVLYPFDHAARCDLSIDCAWGYTLTKQWEEAHRHLQLAKQRVLTVKQSADINSVFCELYRLQANYNEALDHGYAALMQRESLGDLVRVADSYNNLGIVYAKMGVLEEAIQMYTQARDVYLTAGNEGALADIYTNIGAVYFYHQQYANAIEQYQLALKHFVDCKLPRKQASTYYNLAEAYIALEQQTQARQHLEKGIEIASEHNCLHICSELVKLQTSISLSPHSVSFSTGVNDESLILMLAKTQGSVSPKMLVSRGLSRSTAQRRLRQLENKGWLHKVGKRGQGVHYILREPDS